MKADLETAHTKKARSNSDRRQEDSKATDATETYLKATHVMKTVVVCALETTFGSAFWLVDVKMEHSDWSRGNIT